MSNSYKYIDPDFTYTEPKTGLLRNLQEITDPDVLLFVESGVVTKRLQELYERSIKIKGIDSLFEIHRHLFQDIYVWAGKKRMVEISKDGKQFFPTSHFDNAFRYIDYLIAEFNKIPKDSLPYFNQEVEISEVVHKTKPNDVEKGKAKTQLEDFRAQIISGKTPFADLAKKYSQLTFQL